MCGISGFQGDFGPSLLEAMNHLIAYRGPDDAGIHYDSKNRTGFAHRRLSIIDLSPLGKQPMWDSTGSAITTFNGEIYNYPELREELLSQGFLFRSATDTEVLLNLYLRDGTEMLGQLNGMFAFAIFDTRDRSLFVARDGLGVKPLYYTEVPKGFLFSSELKAILLERSVSREICAQALHSYLTYLWCPSPSTMLKHVKKLEPGWALKVREGRVVAKWQFYELPYGVTSDRLSVKQATAEFRDAFYTAVKRQMVSDAPLGAFLSGGLDSSSVVAAARHHQPAAPLKCYSISAKGISKEGFGNDAAYAKQVANYLGVELSIIEADVVQPTDLSEMIYHLDEPQADPAALLVRHISRLAKSQGVKVLLSGTGGDDILCGYRRHQAITLEKYWSWLPRSWRKLIKGLVARLPTGAPFFRRVRKAFDYADSSNFERIVGYLKWIAPDYAVTLYGARMRQELTDREFSTNGVSQTLKKLPQDTPALIKLLFLDAKHFLTDHNLNYADKMSMAEGVEVRVPYLDPDLIALVSRLPADYKQHGLTGKWILRETMRSVLPREVLHRPKTGFVVPVRAWFQNRLPDFFRELLDESTLAKRQWFDPVGVKSLIEMNRRGIVDAAYPLLAIVCIEIWLQSFIDPLIPCQLT
jgi:asparagine synthase (glutamine-hydrolysing)